MRLIVVTGRVLGALLLVVAQCAWADTIEVTFPELQNPPTFSVAGPFPQPSVQVATVGFAIPHGSRIVAAQVSGFWGSSSVSESTAGVDVLLDGVLIAQC